MRKRIAAAAFPAAVALAVCSCSRDKPPVVPDRVWVVVGHRTPGVSAMTEADAFNRHGHLIHLSRDRAVSTPDTCDSPSYRESNVPADSLLAVDYHVQPADLGLAPGQNLQVMEVLCDGAPWAATGGRIFCDAPGHGFTVWDGVFFEVKTRGR